MSLEDLCVDRVMSDMDIEGWVSPRGLVVWKWKAVYI
jgi:hypothetical protein